MRPLHDALTDRGVRLLPDGGGRTDHSPGGTRGDASPRRTPGPGRCRPGCARVTRATDEQDLHELQERAAEALDRLDEAYPEARIELEFRTPFELLIATILSAQCTDRRVNGVTRTLFTDYPDAASYASADRHELEEAIRSTGFFRQKAKSLQGCCAALVDEHGGEVPRDLEALTRLPGVGRKTDNVVRAGAFGLPGIAVDTHCKRVSQRLGLSMASGPEPIERDLNALYPEDRWAAISRLFIWHGRYTCKSRRPLCERCALPDLCPWYRDQG